MTSLDDMIKLAQKSQNIDRGLGISRQLSEIMKAQGRVTNNFSGLSMMTAVAKAMQQKENFAKSIGSKLAKSLQHQERFRQNLGGLSLAADLAKSIQKQQMAFAPSASAIDALTKSMRYAIPQTTFDAITSINRQHQQLFGNLRSIAEASSKNQSAFAKINNWQFAVSGISGQLASIAATQRKWDLIENFEEITEEAISLNGRIFDNNGVTKEGLDDLRAFFQRIEIKVDKIDADANALFWKLLALLSFMLAVMGEARNWLPKPEYATKQEVESLIKEQFSVYEKKLKEGKEYRITNRVCFVMSKPRLKSIVIEKLPVAFEVTVLQVHHKWIYVSYFSKKDNLPQTGWIMKKYLDKPER